MEYKLIGSLSDLFAASRLEFIFPRSIRLTAFRCMLFLTVAALLLYDLSLAVLLPIFLEITNTISFFAEFSSFNNQFFGLFLVFGSVAWFLALIDFYFLSTSVRVPFLAVKEGGEEKIFYMDFGGARRMFYMKALFTDSYNISKLYSFFKESSFAYELMRRLGVDWGDFLVFLNDEHDKLWVSESELLEALIKEADNSASQVVGAKEFVMLLYNKNEAFRDFLFDRNVHVEDLLGASEWVGRMLEGVRASGRWWRKKNLGRIPGIGSTFGYGSSYYLDKYASDFVYSRRNVGRAESYVAHKSEMKQVEEILSRSVNANVMLVGEPGRGKHTILNQLAIMMAEGSAMPALSAMRMVNLDMSSVSAAAKTKGEFEEIMIRIMNDAEHAGNIILVIDNFSEYSDSASALGVNLIVLLKSYLERSLVRTIAISDASVFHGGPELDTKIIKHFDKVEVSEVDNNSSLTILQDLAYKMEKKSGVFITFQALKECVSLSEKYVPLGEMPEKAIDLLDRAITYASSRQSAVLTGKEIKVVLEREFNIPIEKPSKKEAEKLLNIESALHKYVIGQDEAIRQVSDALRKARAGLHESRKPIGSFLFLGPTGVGKTQTAKALSKVYFGSEENIMRFDMSEYQGEEGINKLIGSFDTKEQGLLAISLRKRPFGLLLFDEIEKASKTVLNVFLQILDEGYFTDALGKKIAASQTMIIMTSNAGSNMIWDIVKKGEDPALKTKEIIDYIRRDGKFSPEILNRFDAIVVFHPLNEDEKKQIARLMLIDLKNRLREQDINLEINDDIIERVVTIGHDSVMGARPMKRAIADRIEQKIAKLILEGRLGRGKSISFTKEDSLDI